MSNPLARFSDGQTLATAAIQEALDAGPGRVVLPPGRYLCGTLQLRSGVTLEIQTGATLLGSPRLDDYLPRNRKKGDRHPYHFLVADNVEDVMLCGGGTIDGNGPAFWEPQTHPRAWIAAKPQRVSPMLDFHRCRDLRIENLTITNSPGWTVHLQECDRVWVRGVRLLNPLFGPNTDGFDINGCRDVLLSDCHIECGDDAICLKSTYDARACERVTATNCIIRTHCVGFKIGSETHHPIRQVVFSNSIVYRSHRLFGIWVFDGALVEDVICANLMGDTNSGFLLNRPIQLDLRRRGNVGPEAAAAHGHAEVEHVGCIRNVMVTNFSARTDGRILLTGADGGRLENITLDNIALTYPILDDPQPRAAQARSAQFANHSPAARAARAAVVAENIDRLQLSRLILRWPTGEVPADWGDDLPADESSWRMDAARVRAAALNPPPFHAVWGRGLREARLDCAAATASQPGLAAFDLGA